MHLVKMINYIKTRPILSHVEHLELYILKLSYTQRLSVVMVSYKNKSKFSSVRPLNSLLPNIESKVPDLSSRTRLVRTGLFLLSGCFVVWIIPMSSISHPSREQQQPCGSEDGWGHMGLPLSLPK